MDRLEELWKYCYGWSSFRDAIRFAKEAERAYSLEDDTVLKALTYSTVIAYARPFRQKKGVRLSEDLVEPWGADCHEFLMEMRDKVVSHQDPVTTEASFGNLNQVSIEYDGPGEWRAKTTHPRLLPPKCMEIIELASDLLAKCDERAGNVLKLIESSSTLERGEYTLTPYPTSDQVRFELVRRPAEGE